MEMTYVGIDVSKDRLDVHVLPEGETFVVAPDGKGLAEFVERMGTLGPERIPVEATGGSETVVAAAPAGASLPVVVVNPAQVRPSLRCSGAAPASDSSRKFITGDPMNPRHSRVCCRLRAETRLAE
jgi:transposase